MTTFPGTSGNGAQSAQGAGGFGERVDRMGSDAQHLWDDARGAVTDLSQTLDIKGRVERNPYGMVLAALGVGYVLGGGLFTPMTGRVLRLGVRLAALPFVKDELLTMAQAALDGYQTGRSAVGASEPTGGTPGTPGAPRPGTF